MDSRHYIISFALQSLSEVPSDFDLPSDLDVLEAGVFLPQDNEPEVRKFEPALRVIL